MSDPEAYRMLLERAHVELRRLRAESAHRREPLAILGLGCRFPGGADDPSTFWDLLRAGYDGVREVPPERWDSTTLYDPDPGAPGKMSTRWGGFLAGDIAQFDARFFGISAREAAKMDPQQRLLLEVAWEALEDAGLIAEELAGRRVGVYVGISSGDYQLITARSVAEIDAYVGTGNAHSVAAGRLAYVFGLLGPSIAVDTACSSSLVASHLAAQALRAGEIDVALVGGVNLMLAPEVTISFSKARMMAADGRCKTFDARADGYVRGEGCGVVVLKRLSDATRDGDRIRALLAGTAVNQDGRSAGLTVPNGTAQEAVIRDALSSAGLAAAMVDHVEAHGTGTALGDPIELHALARVFARSAQDPLLTSSVKANIGHLEAAAGVAGLIKMVLAIEAGELPPQAHFHALTPHARELTGIDVPRAIIAWPARGTRRVAGVSSFGFSGTNAHAIVSSPPLSPAKVPADAVRREWVVPLSARSPEALVELRRCWAEWLRRDPAISFADVAYTAAVRRQHHAHRVAVVGATAAQLAAQLAGSSAHGTAPAEALALAERYGRGEAVDWRAVYPAGRCVSLPTHRWSRRRYWVERAAAEPVLIGPRCDSASSAGAHYWPIEMGASVDPSRTLQAVLAAAAELDSSLRLNALEFDDFVATPVAQMEGQLTIVRRGDGAASVEVYVRAAPPTPGAPWRRVARGDLVRNEPWSGLSG